MFNQSRFILFIPLTLGLLFSFACQQPPGPTSKSTTPKAKKNKKKLSQKPSKSITMDKAMYEAEIAHLKERVQNQDERTRKWPIINVHEHLLQSKHLPAYLAAARRIGVAQTVVVTSPEFTLFGKGTKGEPTMSKNWLNVKLAAKTYPGEIIPFMTIDPKDPDRLKKAKRMVSEGALGVKLYTGHSNLYEKPLDDPSMDEIYAYLEEMQLPINWHINLTKFSGEFENVMKKYPKLNVMVPHYGVAFWRPKKLADMARLMRTYPGLYLDTSLGTREILLDGMRVIEREDVLPKFKAFLEEFQDRIVYGSDSVITGNKEKTTNWYYLVLAATMDHLEEDTFTFPLAEAYSRYFKKGKDPAGRFRGFGLSDEKAKKIYVDNAKAWLEKYKPLAAPPNLKALLNAPSAPAVKDADPKK